MNDTSQQDFLHTTFGKDGPNVFRLGLSTTLRPGEKAVYKAIDEGVNFFFAYGFDRNVMKVLRDVFRRDREKYVIATGPYNLIWTHTDVRKTFEKRLRQLKTDYIDVFLFLGVMKEKQLPGRVKEEMVKLREEGKVKRIGLSCHDRKFVGRLASDGDFDAFMMRYNAAHRGAEVDIFPHLAAHDPGVISYTATRWGYLIRRPKNYPEEGRIPTAGDCYRFVLANPHVDVCLTAPSNIHKLEENIAAVRKGPLSDDDMEFMKNFGDIVHHTKKYFM